MSSDGSAFRRALEFGPAPEGFRTDLPTLSDLGAAPAGGGGLHVLLMETEHDLTGAQPRLTSRLVRQIASRDGLQTAGRFDVVFDPQYERLVIHHLRVIRKDVVREAAKAEAFEMMRREPNLERAVYDGRMTAHMVIPDLREGDVIDSCFSIIGEPPGLQKTFGWGFILQFTVPVGEVVCRIRAPEGRKLRSRAFGDAPAPVVVERDGVREQTWAVKDGKPLENEPFAPIWEIRYAAVEVADDLSWTAVADLFRPFYEAAIATEAPELDTEAEALAAAHPEKADLLLAALRHVQRSLRYHSVAIGEGGYRPRSVDQIWAGRYGDCKDASVLLTAILRRLGFTACCALVNTAVGPDLPQAVMGPRAFNHCIVRVTLDGVDYWLDPTCPPQGGDLAHLNQARDGYALPLVPDAGLVAIPPLEMGLLRETTERWSFPRNTGWPAELNVRICTRQWQADQVRHVFSNQDVADIGQRYSEELSKELRSSLTTREPLRSEDDFLGNAFTTFEAYGVDRALSPTTNGHARFVSSDGLVGGNLPVIPAGPRTQSIVLGAPRIVTLRREFVFAADTNFAPFDQTETGPEGLEGRNKFEWISDREGVHTLTLKIPTPTLPMEQASAYRDFVERMMANNGISFLLQTTDGRHQSSPSASSESGFNIFGMLIAGAVLLMAVARCATMS